MLKSKSEGCKYTDFTQILSILMICFYLILQYEVLYCSVLTFTSSILQVKAKHLWVHIKRFHSSVWRKILRLCPSWKCWVRQPWVRVYIGPYMNVFEQTHGEHANQTERLPGPKTNPQHTCCEAPALTTAPPPLLLVRKYLRFLVFAG